MPERCVIFGAHDVSGDMIAGAFNLVGSDCIYGRYWGALKSYKALHFELCYYQVCCTFLFECGSLACTCQTPVTLLRWTFGLCMCVCVFLNAYGASQLRMCLHLCCARVVLVVVDVVLWVL